ncbi:hypothetical protein HDU96_010595 [Phlyctochytrium bullatum]|nr:hypothetical protein HDU96_010595 [Phlyctochytrium bullatum]
MLQGQPVPADLPAAAPRAAAPAAPSTPRSRSEGPPRRAPAASPRDPSPGTHLLPAPPPAAGGGYQDDSSGDDRRGRGRVPRRRPDAPPTTTTPIAAAAATPASLAPPGGAAPSRDPSSGPDLSRSNSATRPRWAETAAVARSKSITGPPRSKSIPRSLQPPQAPQPDTLDADAPPRSASRGRVPAEAPPPRSASRGRVPTDARRAGRSPSAVRTPGTRPKVVDYVETEGRSGEEGEGVPPPVPPKSPMPSEVGSAVGGQQLPPPPPVPVPTGEARKRMTVGVAKGGEGVRRVAPAAVPVGASSGEEVPVASAAEQPTATPAPAKPSILKPYTAPTWAAAGRAKMNPSPPQQQTQQGGEENSIDPPQRQQVQQQAPPPSAYERKPSIAAAAEPVEAVERLPRKPTGVNPGSKRLPVEAVPAPVPPAPEPSPVPGPVPPPRVRVLPRRQSKDDFGVAYRAEEPGRQARGREARAEGGRSARAPSRRREEGAAAGAPVAAGAVRGRSVPPERRRPAQGTQEAVSPAAVVADGGNAGERKPPAPGSRAAALMGRLEMLLQEAEGWSVPEPQPVPVAAETAATEQPRRSVTARSRVGGAERAAVGGRVGTMTQEGSAAPPVAARGLTGVNPLTPSSSFPGATAVSGVAPAPVPVQRTAGGKPRVQTFDENNMDGVKVSRVSTPVLASAPVAVDDGLSVAGGNAWRPAHLSVASTLPPIPLIVPASPSQEPATELAAFGFRGGRSGSNASTTSTAVRKVTQLMASTNRPLSPASSDGSSGSSGLEGDQVDSVLALQEEAWAAHAGAAATNAFVGVVATPPPPPLVSAPGVGMARQPSGPPGGFVTNAPAPVKPAPTTPLPPTPAPPSVAMLVKRPEYVVEPGSRSAGAVASPSGPRSDAGSTATASVRVPSNASSLPPPPPPLTLAASGSDTEGAATVTAAPEGAAADGAQGGVVKTVLETLWRPIKQGIAAVSTGNTPASASVTGGGGAALPNLEPPTNPVVAENAGRVQKVFDMTPSPPPSRPSSMESGAAGKRTSRVEGERGRSSLRSSVSAGRTRRPESFSPASSESDSENDVRRGCGLRTATLHIKLRELQVDIMDAGKKQDGAILSRWKSLDLFEFLWKCMWATRGGITSIKNQIPANLETGILDAKGKLQGPKATVTSHERSLDDQGTTEDVGKVGRNAEIGKATSSDGFLRQSFQALAKFLKGMSKAILIFLERVMQFINIADQAVLASGVEAGTRAKSAAKEVSAHGEGTGVRARKCERGKLESTRLVLESQQAFLRHQELVKQFQIELEEVLKWRDRVKKEIKKDLEEELRRWEEAKELKDLEAKMKRRCKVAEGSAIQQKWTKYHLHIALFGVAPSKVPRYQRIANSELAPVRDSRAGSYRQTRDFCTDRHGARDIRLSACKSRFA